MATVHLGRLLGAAGFAKTVAIKRMHEHFAQDGEFVAMFIDEARVAARVNHPNVAQTIDVFDKDGQLFVVMEYVHGLPLSTLIRLASKSSVGFPVPVVTAVMVGLLRGLQAAHDARDETGAPLGIVHRDISPHNVLVGVDGIPRIIDFGVAKATGRLQNTQEGQLKGKVPYMSPEQVTGLPLDRRSDVYSAAVVLWECLAMRRLFDRENDAANLTAILHGTVDPPSSYRPDVPAVFDTIVQQGLAKRTNDRFASALAMERALEATGQVASPGEVSAWIEQVAPGQLRARAELVASVESPSSLRASAPVADASGSLRASAPLADASGPVAVAASAVVTAPPIGPLTWGDRAEHPVTRTGTPTVSATSSGGGRSSLLAPALALLIFAPLVAIALSTFSRSPEAQPPSARISAASDVASTGSATKAADTDAEDAAPKVAASAASASASSPRPGSTAPIRPVKAPVGAKTAAPTVGCDPPYTLDAKGNKQWKLDCL